MTRRGVHLGFGVAMLAVIALGGWLWAEWGAAALLNGFAAICG
jgi:hypothetical protein